MVTAMSKQNSKQDMSQQKPRQDGQNSKPSQCDPSAKGQDSHREPGSHC